MIAYGDNIKVFCGNSNPEFAKTICKELGVEIGDSEVKTFADGEVSVSLNETVRGADVFLIQSTISTGITVRRAEIGIMRLMGASDFFIRAPFIVEGVVIGFVGALIPLIILLISYSSIVQYIKTKFDMISSWMTFLPAGTVFKVLIPTCLVIGIGVGFLGSFFTVRKHLDI